MTQDMVTLGRVVLSLAGRDKGRAFLITGTADEKHVLLVDGVTRKLAKPKKKKLMHLKAEKAVAENVAAKLRDGTGLNDADARKALVSLGYNSDAEKQEG